MGVLLVIVTALFASSVSAGVLFQEGRLFTTDLRVILGSTGSHVIDDFVDKLIKEADQGEINKAVTDQLKEVSIDLPDNYIFKGHKGSLSNVDIFEYDTATSSAIALNTSYLEINLQLNLPTIIIDFEHAEYENSDINLRSSSAMSINSSIGSISLQLGMSYNLTKCITTVGKVNIGNMKWNEVTLQNGVVNFKLGDTDDTMVTSMVDKAVFMLDDKAAWASKWGFEELISGLSKTMSDCLNTSINTSLTKVLTTYSRDICHDIDI